MGRLAERREARLSGNWRSNPARKLGKSSFSCQRASSKPGKRLAIRGVGLHGGEGITRAEHDDGALELVGEKLQQVQRSALLECGPCEYVVHLVDDDQPGRNLAQQHERGVLDGGQPVAGPVGSVQGHQELPVEATLLGCRGHLHGEHVDLQQAGSSIELLRWVRAGTSE